VIGRTYVADLALGIRTWRCTPRSFRACSGSCANGGNLPVDSRVGSLRLKRMMGGLTAP
jgi:hypothetical protein